MVVSPQKKKKFQSIIKEYYRVHGRDLPWRRTVDPYHIVVSEIMLQQTQVARVLKKYPEFIKAFPNFRSLSRAPLVKVLSVWRGMGYNRRALALRKVAQRVMEEYNGKLPCSTEVLVTFPGIGKATAASIVSFAFNEPAVFIETNIRSVYLHYFFARKKGVLDVELMPLIERTLDRENPREWYYALMDYGTMLKALHANPSRKSGHYRAQSAFKGSRRQVRGALLALLTQGRLSKVSLSGAALTLRIPRARLQEVARDLAKEGFIAQHGETVRIK